MCTKNMTGHVFEYSAYYSKQVYQDTRTLMYSKEGMLLNKNTEAVKCTPV